MAKVSDSRGSIYKELLFLGLKKFPGRKNFENTPPLRIGKNIPPSAALRAAAIFWPNFEINVNLTGFSLNLVKLKLIQLN